MKQIKFLFLIFFVATSLFAQTGEGENPRYLQITTTPAGADVYLNTATPNHARRPDFELPGYIRVPEGERSILVSLFRPEFADTAINVNLSKKDTSYLVVTLRPHYDETLSREQYSELSHRNRKSIGHKLLWTSAVPFLASGIAALVAHYEIGRANDAKEEIEESLIHSGKKYKQMNKDFKDARKSADRAKDVAKFGLILGGSIFAVGLVLSF